MQKERFIYDNTLEASFFYQMLVFFLKKNLVPRYICTQSGWSKLGKMSKFIIYHILFTLQFIFPYKN